ncbi:monovalent cation/H+ antiporter subunit E [Halobacterium jilantaiense]|uniref:Multisubunit sodium/proton antiporter, MrpE subunit n=1 Tax=Halobacterium jilantaiense TaxID=355548 RepID=A0A1I0NL75_9EURY|nr:monovalent cation/H+ antiporter subunit E [Halobacterium jilantaiense]SEW02201.1 multisubunit sodium/proton antiporter, MrpE subunit [Halobacterium jilantaiense]
MSGADLLVPVEDSVSLRQTVAHVAERARDAGVPVTLHFVCPISERPVGGGDSEVAGDAEALLDRIEVWAEEDLGEHSEDVSVVTSVVGADVYLFNPGDYADVLVAYARRNGVDTVVLDPEFNPLGMAPLLPPLERELEAAGLNAELAPVERATRRGPLTRPAGLDQFVLLFASTFGFYLLIAGELTVFNVATGAVTGTIVAALLRRITTRGSVDLPGLAGRLGRMALYVPYLLWEIVKANISIAKVVLHPRLPIDPKVVEFDAAVWSELPATTLANSITLTPGTLTVDVTQRHFTVHSLTTGSRSDLLAGGLERAVRFVFYGRAAMRLPTPAERGETMDGSVDGARSDDADEVQAAIERVESDTGGGEE